MSEVTRHRPWGDSVPTEFVLASDYDQLKAENEVLTLRVMAGERQELDALKSAPVVMPERRIQALAGVTLFDIRHAKGWNACLDEFESLNGGKKDETVD